MNARELLNALSIAVKLKDTTRHCYTEKGRHESVAEHTWMMTMIAFFIMEEFPQVDMNKVIQMCIIHDLGECFTGDIPTFIKNRQDDNIEQELLNKWVDSLPNNVSKKMRDLYHEMEEQESIEAKIYKAIDSQEALIQHNFSDLSTWTEHEKSFNLNYADDRVQFSDYMKKLREEIRKDTIIKLED